MCSSDVRNRPISRTRTQKSVCCKGYSRLGFLPGPLGGIKTQGLEPTTIVVHILDVLKGQEPEKGASFWDFQTPHVSAWVVFAEAVVVRELWALRSVNFSECDRRKKQAVKSFRPAPGCLFTLDPASSRNTAAARPTGQRAP